MQNQKISELYTDNNKSKYSSNSKHTIKSWKNFVKNPTPSTQLPKLLLVDFLARLLTEYLMNNLPFNLWGKNIVDEIIKSINFQTINKFQDNYGLTAQFNIYNFQMNYLLYV